MKHDVKYKNRFLGNANNKLVMYVKNLSIETQKTIFHILMNWKWEHTLRTIITIFWIVQNKLRSKILRSYKILVFVWSFELD